MLCKSGKGVVTDEIKEYILCKEIYRCSPSQLDDCDPRTLDLHFMMYNTENKVQKIKIKEQEQKNSLRKR